MNDKETIISLLNEFANPIKINPKSKQDNSKKNSLVCSKELDFIKNHDQFIK